MIDFEHGSCLQLQAATSSISAGIGAALEDGQDRYTTTELVGRVVA